MYKFIITLDLEPGTRDRILERAPEAQAASRAVAGCILYDIYAAEEYPDRLIFVEAWQDQAAHRQHLKEEHTKRFIAFHEQFHRKLTFELITPEEDAA